MKRVSLHTQELIKNVLSCSFVSWSLTLPTLLLPYIPLSSPYLHVLLPIHFLMSSSLSIYFSSIHTIHNIFHLFILPETKRTWMCQLCCETCKTHNVWVFLLWWKTYLVYLDTQIKSWHHLRREELGIGSHSYNPSLAAVIVEDDGWAALAMQVHSSRHTSRYRYLYISQQHIKL